ncbi:MAG: hypothetical protein GXP03_08990 [Alphaproteobacteria bacterium]|nr:hypothetical protein [Alphaproteobacteria bacterium]
MYQQFSEHDVGGFEEIVSPDWSDEESYNIELMLEQGLLLKSEETDFPWLGGAAPDDPYKEAYIRPTTLGHIFFENSGWWKYIVRNLCKNIPTIIASAIAAILIAWVVKIFGPSN